MSLRVAGLLALCLGFPFQVKIGLAQYKMR